MTTAEIRAAKAAWRKLRADIHALVKLGTPTRLVRFACDDYLVAWVDIRIDDVIRFAYVGPPDRE